MNGKRRVCRDKDSQVDAPRASDIDGFTSGRSPSRRGGEQREAKGKDSAAREAAVRGPRPGRAIWHAPGGTSETPSQVARGPREQRRSAVRVLRASSSSPILHRDRCNGGTRWIRPSWIRPQERGAPRRAVVLKNGLPQNARVPMYVRRREHAATTQRGRERQANHSRPSCLSTHVPGSAPEG